MLKKLAASLLAFSLMGCSSADIPPSHKGRKLDKTGVWAAYRGGNGFDGPVLGPGTVWLGIYPELRMIDCGQKTVMEHLDALTKDGVQFKLNVYISYGANCDSNDAIIGMLNKMSPASNNTISSLQIYQTYIVPALGEAVRESVSPFIANQINEHREDIFGNIKKSFENNLKGQSPAFVTIYSLNLSNLDFPEDMDKANLERATQAIYRDKSIAEREKVLAEIETAKLHVTQETVKAEAEAAKINVIGKALHNNPEYYLRDIYAHASEKGNAMIVPQNPNLLLQMTPKVKEEPKSK